MAEEIVATKRCGHCHLTLPLTGFYKSKSNGHKHWCKTCSSEAARRWREGNRERVIEYHRKRMEDPARRERKRETDRNNSKGRGAPHSVAGMSYADYRRALYAKHRTARIESAQEYYAAHKGECKQRAAREVRSQSREVPATVA